MPTGIGTATLIAGLAGAGASAATGIYGAKKASEAAKLPPAQQAAQDAAARENSRRLTATGPMFDRLLAGYGQRLPGGAPGNMTGQTQARPRRMRYDAMPEASSGTTQAVQALAQGMRGRGGGGGQGRIIWGDRRDRGYTG